ncbi:MAG: hypothetical protein ACRDOK_13125 [Streptosporangiaceae bacterium]
MTDRSSYSFADGMPLTVKAAWPARWGGRACGSRGCGLTSPRETYPGVREEDLQPPLKDTLLGRLPSLAEMAGTAVYLASDAAGAITGAMVNLTCGAIID